MSAARNIVNKMMETDAFSQWLGIEILEIKPGYCKLKMKVRDEMVNGFDNVHGGITYSFADSALAFAANGHGKMSVALDCTISYPNATKKGDVIVAEATECSVSNRVGVYDVRVTNQQDQLVALFRGTVYRTSKEWSTN